MIVKLVVEALARVVLSVWVGPPEKTTFPAVPVSSDKSAASWAEVVNDDDSPSVEVAMAVTELSALI